MSAKVAWLQFGGSDRHARLDVAPHDVTERGTTFVHVHGRDDRPKSAHAGAVGSVPMTSRSGHCLDIKVSDIAPERRPALTRQR